MDWLHHPSYTPARDQLIGRLKSRVFRFKHLRPLVFLCGKKNSSNRDIIRTYLNKHHGDLLVFYAEQIWQHISVKEKLNALEMEDQLARLSDLVVIIVESPGTFTELGAFSLNDNLRPKLLAFLDQDFKNATSFINTGPITWINKDSRYGTIFTDFNAILTSAYELDERLKKIPRRGRLKKDEEVLDIHEKPKHLLFLLCDLLAVIGPATSEHCEYYLKGILEKRTSWSIPSLLSLGVSLKLLSQIHHPQYSSLYYRPLLGGELQSFQHQEMFNLSSERARFLSIYQTIPSLRGLLHIYPKEVSND